MLHEKREFERQPQFFRNWPKRASGQLTDPSLRASGEDPRVYCTPRGRSMDAVADGARDARPVPGLFSAVRSCRQKPENVDAWHARRDRARRTAKDSPFDSDLFIDPAENRRFQVEPPLTPRALLTDRSGLSSRCVMF